MSILVLGNHLYINTIRGFLLDRGVYGRMQINAKEQGLHICESELDSWKANVKALKELFRSTVKNSRYFLDCLVMLEDCITEDLRADCVIMGKNSKKKATVVVMELKQWSDDFISKPESEEEISAGRIITRYRNNLSCYHPSRQVSEYRWNLNNYPVFLNREMRHVGIAYCYNCERGMQAFKVLYDKEYDDYLKDCKLYTRMTKDSLVKVLLNNLQFGDGQEVYNRL